MLSLWIHAILKSVIKTQNASFFFIAPLSDEIVRGCYFVAWKHLLKCNFMFTLTWISYEEEKFISRELSNLIIKTFFKHLIWKDHKWQINPFCMIQLCQMNVIPLLSKPCVNEVTLRKQKLPLECCQPLDFWYTVWKV